MRIHSSRLLLLVFGAILVLVSACDDGDSSTYAPTGFSDATVEADATVTATPEPISAEDADAVFAVKAALETQDPEVIRPLIGYRKIGCLEEAGEEGFPVCANGEREGDQVDAFYFSSCEGQYLRPTEIDLALETFTTTEVHSAYRLPNRTDTGYQYAVILVDHHELRDGMAWEAVVDQGQIIGLLFSCALSPEELIRTRDYRVIVPEPAPTEAATPVP